MLVIHCHVKKKHSSFFLFVFFYNRGCSKAQIVPACLSFAVLLRNDGKYVY